MSKLEGNGVRVGAIRVSGGSTEHDEQAARAGVEAMAAR